MRNTTLPWASQFTRKDLVYYPHHQDFTPQESLLFLMGTVPQFVLDLKARGVQQVVLEETGVGTTRHGYRLHWAEITDMLPPEADAREFNTHRE